MAIVPSALNGRFPSAFFSVLPGKDGRGDPHIADRLAVESYWRLSRDFEAARNGLLIPSDGFSCYRTLDDQKYMRLNGYTTIPVGKSIHGEAGGKAAVDFAGLPFDSKRHNWMKANAGRYGWEQPAWAQEGGSLPESWHWEYDSRKDQAPGPKPDPTPTPTPEPVPEEDDMTPEQAEALSRIDTFVQQIEAGPVYGIPGSDARWTPLGDSTRQYLDPALNASKVRPTVVPLDPRDDFWGRGATAPGETYRQKGEPTGAVWVQTGDANGKARRHHLTAQEYADMGRPPYKDLDPSNPFWSVPTI